MKTRIICAGTFDLLHTGHLAYFKAAKALAEHAYLIVIVSRDANSEQIKKKKTLHDELTRLARIKKLPMVDEAVLGYEGNNFIERIVDLKPDIIALGHDQWAQESWLMEALQKRNISARIVRMPKFEKRLLD
jgi:FAD synthetase